MAKKTSKAGSSAASAPPKATNNNDFDIDDIFSGKPLKSKPAPVASSSSAKPKAVNSTSTNKAEKKDKKKKKKAVGDWGDEVQAGIAVNGGKGKRKADGDNVVEPATKSKKTKIMSELQPSKTSKSVQKKLRDDDDEDDEEDLDEDYTDENDDETSTPKVVEVLDPSAVSRSKVKQALQPPPSRSKGGRREVDAEEEMFKDSRGDGPSTSHAAPSSMI
jgi:hypothetical protein